MAKNWTKWTAEDIEFLIAHYQKDMTTKAIAKHLGFSVDRICNKACEIRAINPDAIKSKVAVIGEVRTRIEKCGRTSKRIKTEKGWRWMPLDPSEMKKRGGIPTPRHKVGAIITKVVGNFERDYEKQIDGTWKCLPGTGKRIRETVPKPKVIIKPVQKNKPQSIPKKKFGSQPALSTDRNPERMKIMSDAEKIAAGYRYVQINSKTRVLRHPSKLLENPALHLL